MGPVPPKTFRTVTTLAAILTGFLFALTSPSRAAEPTVIANITDCYDADEGIDWVCVALEAGGFYIKHASQINHGVGTVIQSLTHFAPAARVSQDMTTIIKATPYITVISSESPCSGGDTVEIRYHVDGSRDCVEPTSTHIVQSRDVNVLIIETVNAKHKVNNGLVYQLDQRTPGNSHFLGTLLLNDHDDLNISYADKTYIVLDFTDPNGLRTSCVGQIAQGLWHQKC